MGFEPLTLWLQVESVNHYTTVLPLPNVRRISDNKNILFVIYHFSNAFSQSRLKFMDYSDVEKKLPRPQMYHEIHVSQNGRRRALWPVKQTCKARMAIRPKKFCYVALTRPKSENWVGRSIFFYVFFLRTVRELSFPIFKKKVSKWGKLGQNAVKTHIQVLF